MHGMWSLICLISPPPIYWTYSPAKHLIYSFSATFWTFLQMNLLHGSRCSLLLLFRMSLCLRWMPPCGLSFWSVVIFGIQGLSVPSSWRDIFHCRRQCLVAPVQSESCSNVAWPSRPSIFGTYTFLCKIFCLRHMLLSFGICQILSCYQQSCRLMILFWRCW